MFGSPLRFEGIKGEPDYQRTSENWVKPLHRMFIRISGLQRLGAVEKFQGKFDGRSFALIQRVPGIP